MCLTVVMPTPATVEVHGPAIREIRIRSGMGVAALAAAAGIARPHMANVELGHRRRVTPETFNALVAALAITDRRAILANPYGADAEAVA